MDQNENNRSELGSARSEGQKSIAESKAEDRLEEIKYKMDNKKKGDFDTSSRLADQVAADD